MKTFKYLFCVAMVAMLCPLSLSAQEGVGLENATRITTLVTNLNDLSSALLTDI